MWLIYREKCSKRNCMLKKILKTEFKVKHRKSKLINAAIMILFLPIIIRINGK